MEQVRVVVKEPGKMPEERMVEPMLDAWQAIVGGSIEMAFVGAGGPPHIPMFINEEGKLLELPPNVLYGGSDYIAGTLVVFADDGEGNETGLSDEQVKAATRWLTAMHITHV